MVFFMSMGALALAKGTGSFGLARATGTVASAEAETLETWAQRVVRPMAVEGCQEEEVTCHRCWGWGLRRSGCRVLEVAL